MKIKGELRTSQQ